MNLSKPGNNSLFSDDPAFFIMLQSYFYHIDRGWKRLSSSAIFRDIYLYFILFFLREKNFINGQRYCITKAKRENKSVISIKATKMQFFKAQVQFHRTPMLCRSILTRFKSMYVYSFESQLYLMYILRFVAPILLHSHIIVNIMRGTCSKDDINRKYLNYKNDKKLICINNHTELHNSIRRRCITENQQRRSTRKNQKMKYSYLTNYYNIYDLINELDFNESLFFPLIIKRRLSNE